jgi:uncharacterized protein with HEPN domain
MRDVLAKDFIDIDLEVVWKTASEDLPRIVAALRSNRVADRAEPIQPPKTPFLAPRA